MTTTTCPQCGHPASGRFCSNCAAPLASVSCASCGAALSTGARFCHRCGSPTGAAGPAGPPWLWITAIAATALVFASLGFLAGRPNAPLTAATAAGGPAGPVASGTPDLTSLSPREQADRLFDRIMREHEAGNADQAAFFTPMAIQAYQMLGPLDADARYHVGLIESISGGADAALAQADSIEAEAPGHLFAYLLRAGVYQAQGNDTAVLETYRSFLAQYDAEMNRQRPEYEMHGRVIAAFRDEAQANAGGGAP